MNILCSQLEGITVLLIIVVLILGGIYFWHFRFHQQNIHLTDNQIVGMLINLLVFGFINMLFLLLVISGRLGNMMYICH